MCIICNRDAECMLPLILLVDDDAAVAWALEHTLVGAGFRCAVAADARAARRHVQRDLPDLVITDVRMPGESGLDLLAWIHGQHPDLPVIVSTAHGTLEVAMEAVARGAVDHLIKPLDQERLLNTVRRVLGEAPLGAAARPAGAQPEATMVGQDHRMQEVFRRLAAAAASDSTVLITGPSGSGKSLAADLIHRHGRRDAPLVRIAGSALLPDLEGLLGLRGGTVILDEILDLSPMTQARLLAHLDSAGTDAPRLIAVSQRSVTALGDGSPLRPDLVHRLAVLTVELPPLSERGGDIPALVRHLLHHTAHRLGRPLSLTEAALQALTQHTWPGNVRELRHRLEEAALLSGAGIIDREHLRGLATDPGPAVTTMTLPQVVASWALPLLRDHPGQVHERLMGQVETELVRLALAETAGNQLKAAELLGINRITLKKRMDSAGIGKT